MAEIAIQDVPALDGVAPTYAAASAGGDTLTPGASNKLLLHMKNGGAGAITLTIDDVNSTAPLGATAYDPDVQVTIPAGGEQMVTLTQFQRFRNDAGVVNLAWSDVTSLTVAAFRLM